MKHNKKLYAGLCVLAAVIIIGVYFGANRTEAPLTPIETVPEQANSPTIPAASVQEKKDTVPAPKVSETFSLNAGATTLSLPITGGSLLSILNDAQKRGEIVLSGREYTGIGFFVMELGSLKEGDGKHLMYYVNGKEASVGVSLYIPKAGDTVVWELK